MRTGRVSLVVLGTGAVGVQLVFLREVLSTFGGNEIVAGLALGIWLLVTGLGSVLGGRMTPRLPARSAAIVGHLILAWLPLIMLAALRAPIISGGVRGQVANLGHGLLGCAAVFLPFGLISGGMIPLLGRLLVQASPGGLTSKSGTIGRVYVLDTLGSALGGLLFSLVLISLPTHGWSLALFGFLHLAAAGLLGGGRPFVGAGGLLSMGGLFGAGGLLSTGGLFRAGGLLLAALPLLGAGSLDRTTLAWRFPGQTVLLTRNTPFAQLVITAQGEQRNVFQDGVLLCSSGDLSAEARVHPALAQVSPGASVLLVGGTVFGNLAECLKHSPRRIDTVELDSAILDLGTQLTDSSTTSPPPAAPGRPAAVVVTHAGDGRRYLKDRLGEYDAVIVSLPGPENAQINRFYTEEFFRMVRSALRPGGVFSFSLPATPNYIGREQLALERSIWAALRAVFPQVAVLPGESHIYLAGDKPLVFEVPAILEARAVRTRRLLDYDWSELSDPFRRDELTRLLSADPPAAPNRDLSPRAFGYLWAREARKTGADRRSVYLLAGCSLLLAGAAGGRRAARLAVAGSGFVGISVEFLILLIDSARFGLFYTRISIFVTLFLLGAAAGAMLSPIQSRSARWPGTPQRQVAAADLALLILVGLLWALASWEASDSGQAASDWVCHLLHPLLLVGVAALIGLQFAAAGSLLSRDAGLRSEDSGLGRLYLADLTGAASATILIGLVVLPNLGLGGAVIILCILKTASLTGLLWRVSR